jgi:hypothetical protein
MEPSENRQFWRCCKSLDRIWDGGQSSTPIYFELLTMGAVVDPFARETCLAMSPAHLRLRTFAALSLRHIDGRHVGQRLKTRPRK